jgi:hypothetical protein
LRTGLFVGLSLAASAVLAIGLRGPSGRGPVARYHGTITAPASAHFTRVRAAPDELVVLESGTIHVEVSRLGQGERFRVRAGDGEVEVRGTAFDVTVDGGHMERVEVEHGRVEVRRAGAAGAVLGAGEHWTLATAGSQRGDTVPRDDAPPAPAKSAAAPATSPSGPAGPTRRPSQPTGGASVESPSSSARSPEPADAPEPETDVASRLVVPPSAPSVVVPPRPQGVVAPNESAPAAVPATSGRAHEEERRERRDERRERYDQRRLR